LTITINDLMPERITIGNIPSIGVGKKIYLYSAAGSQGLESRETEDRFPPKEGKGHLQNKNKAH